MKRTITLVSLAALVLPTFAFAVIGTATASGKFGGVIGILQGVQDLVSIALPVVAGLALLAFFYGLVKFIFAGAGGKIEGKNFMIWGVVALFVMVSVWGLTRFIADQFDITDTSNVDIPGFNGI